jgi:hypothetical protein
VTRRRTATRRSASSKELRLIWNSK